MKMTKKQFAKIERFMPIARKKPSISNYQFMYALLYIIENGCKMRELVIIDARPKKAASTYNYNNDNDSHDFEFDLGDMPEIDFSELEDIDLNEIFDEIDFNSFFEE